MEEIIILVSPEATPAFAFLRTTLGATEAERHLNYRRHVTAMQQLLDAHKGFPPGSAADETAEPVIYAWTFTDRVLVWYTVYETPAPPRGWWDVARWLTRWAARRRTRTIVIVDLTVVGVPAGGS